MLGMAGSPDKDILAYTSYYLGVSGWLFWAGGRKGAYGASVRGVDLVGHVHGHFVLVGFPRHKGVAVLL